MERQFGTMKQRGRGLTVPRTAETAQDQKIPRAAATEAFFVSSACRSSRQPVRVDGDDEVRTICPAASIPVRT